MCLRCGTSGQSEQKLGIEVICFTDTYVILRGASEIVYSL